MSYRSVQAIFVVHRWRNLFLNINYNRQVCPNGYVDSAGTAGWHSGEGMHCGTADALALYNIASNGFRSRQIRKQDLLNFDYIIAMDDSNLEDLERFSANIRNRFF